MSKLYTADKFVTIGGTTSQYVTGTGSLVTFPTIPSGSDYIQNQNASAQSANMWISGSGTFNSSVTVGGSYYGVDNANLIANNVNTNGTVLNLNSKGTVGVITFQTNSTECMRITSAGNVGIGTTSPSGNLHVYNSSSPTLIYNQNYNGVQSYWNSSDGGVVYFGSTTNHPLAFVTNNTERIRITSGGNVGIGNSSPTEKLDVTGNVKATTFIGALSGNATTATTLQNTRSISLGTAVTSTATNFNGSSNITIPVTGVSEAYLTWGGRSFSGSYGPIDSALMPELGANRLAFTPASAVIIEYSQDGGTTWLNYAVSDAVKINLLNGNSTTIQVGGGGYPVGTDYTNYLVRVTINTAGQIYTALNKFIILVSTNGSTGSYCTVDARTQSNYLAGIDTWTTFSNQTPVAGWSGYNVINTNNITTFGNTPASQFGQVRFTFGQTGYSTSYTGLQIIKLLGFGGVGWQTPSTLAATGQMYTYDYLKNVYFQANLTAVNFIGALSGNATTATTLQTARTINGTSFNGSSNIETSYWGATRTITIGNTAKTVNGSGNQSWSLAEIGAQAALTNPITGTGTTNYLSKFTGTTSLGNSLVFDNGTNVGIGTTSPGSLLQVGQSNTSTDALVRLSVSYSTDRASRGGITWNDTTNSTGKIYTEYDGTMVSMVFGSLFNSGYNSNQLMVIRGNGNVGIGTTSSSSVLHLYRNSTTSPLNFSNSSSLILQNPYGSAGNTGTAIFFKSDVGTYNTFAGIGGNMVGSTANGSYGDIVFGTKAAATDTALSERMRINASGNVGIGTTSPGSLLHMVGTSPELRIASSDGQTTRLGLYEDTAGTQHGGYIQYVGGGDTLRLGIVNSGTSTDVITVTDTFNVGIGTTSPNSTLSVGSSDAGAVITSGGANTHLSLKAMGSAGELIFGAGGVSNGTAGSERMRINSAGNVGIGTSTPQRKLDVISGANNFVSVGISQMSVGQWAGIGFGYAEGSNNLYRKSAIVFERTDLTSNNAQGKVHILNGPQGNGNSATLSDSKLTIAENGNVGIGNTAPTSKLVVDSNTNGADGIVSRNLNTGGSAYAFVGAFNNINNGIDLRSYPSTNLAFPSTSFIASGSGQTGGMIITQAGANPISIWTNGSEKMRVTSDGNVGIGTSIPSTNLEVVGTSFSTPASIRIKQDLGPSYMAMDLICDLFAAAGIIDVGAFGNTIFRRGSSDSMLINGDGYIGINTATPNVRLHLRETTSGQRAMTIQINEDPVFGAGLINFENNAGSGIGSIFYDGFSTSYNTSSDYRLKENVVKIDGALERLKLLKPVNFNFINRPERTVDGFIAHEVKEVIPEAVVGVKDELDENGKPKYQGIDQSKIVPLLTAALQEAIDKISQLEERIQKLENK